MDLLMTLSPKKLFVSVSLLWMLGLFQFSHAVRTPVHVFPESESNVIAELDIDPNDLDQYPKVLDASLEETWYWTTHEDEFTGYVSKRDLERRNRLRPGTLIRVNPTYTSWILTRYEANDDVRVRSRLSVGRVSIRKEIPVYFRAPDSSSSSFEPEKDEPEKVVVPPVISPESEVDETSVYQENPETEEPLAPDPLEEEPDYSAPIYQPAEDPLPVEQPEVPEVMLTPEPEPIDPLLEEQPRISGQDLAQMAPPPASMDQEFEGFLKLVPLDDALAAQFDYQLETKSGKRIVYVDISKLKAVSVESFVDQWINIRGSLEETDPDFTLFIEAKNIWVAP